MQLLFPFLQLHDLARLHRDVQVVGVIAAVDLVMSDQGLRQVQGVDRHVEQTPRIVAPDLSFDCLLTGCQAKDALTAAAARRPVAYEARFEQRHTVATFCEMQCR